MNATDLIGLAGFVLGLPSALVAFGDLKTRRANSHRSLVIHPLTQSLTIGSALSRPRRILSMVIDTYAVALSAALAGEAVIPSGATTDEAEATIAGLLIIATVGLAAWNAGTGQSPGKLLVGGRVVRHSDHAPITFFQALLRIAGHMIPLGFWIVLGGQRRTAADHIIGTSVISTR